MVMRNQHEQPGWWEDLPPKIRERFGTPALDAAETGEHSPLPMKSPAVQVAPRASWEWVRDYSVLAAMFLTLAIAVVFYLLLALAFVDGAAAPAPV